MGATEEQILAGFGKKRRRRFLRDRRRREASIEGSKGDQGRSRELSQEIERLRFMAGSSKESREARREAGLSSGDLKNQLRRARRGFRLSVRDLNQAEQNTNQAFKKVLGRDADPAGLVEFSKRSRGPAGTEQVIRLLSQSAEARRMGVNPIDFGSTPVNPNALGSSKARGYFDAFQRARPGEVVYEDQFRNWVRFGGSPGHFEAELRGEIGHGFFEDDVGNPIPYSLITPQALQTMGGSFTQKGKSPGSVVIMPTGTRRDKFWKKQLSYSDGPLTGYSVFAGQGTPTGGLLGSLANDTGIDEFNQLRDKATPREIWPFLDAAVAGQGAEILGGSQGEAYSSATMDKLGWGTYNRDVNLAVQVIGSMVAGYFLGPYGAAAVSTGLAVTQAAGQEIAYKNTDWTDVAVGVAFTWASAAATSYVSGVAQQRTGYEALAKQANAATGAQVATSSSTISAVQAGAITGTSTQTANAVMAGLSSNANATISAAQTASKLQRAARTVKAYEGLTKGAFAAGRTAALGGDSEAVLMAGAGSVIGAVGGPELVAIHAGARAWANDADWTDVAIAAGATYVGDLVGQSAGAGAEAVALGAASLLAENERVQNQLRLGASGAVAEGTLKLGDAELIKDKLEPVEESVLFGQEKTLFSPSKTAPETVISPDDPRLKPGTPEFFEDIRKGFITGIFPFAQGSVIREGLGLDWSDPRVQSLMAAGISAVAIASALDEKKRDPEFNVDAFLKNEKAALEAIEQRPVQLSTVTESQRAAEEFSSFGAGVNRAGFTDFS